MPVHNRRIRPMPFPEPTSVWHITETQPWSEKIVHAAVTGCFGEGNSRLYKPSGRHGEFFVIFNEDTPGIDPLTFELDLLRCRINPGDNGSYAQVWRIDVSRECLTCHSVHADRPCHKWFTVLEEGAIVFVPDSGGLYMELERIKLMPEEASKIRRVVVKGKKIGVVTANDAIAAKAVSGANAISAPVNENSAAARNVAKVDVAAKVDDAVPERGSTPPVDAEHEVDLSSPVTTETIVPVIQRNTMTAPEPTQDDANRTDNLRSPNTNDGDDEASPSEFSQSHLSAGEEELPTGGRTNAGTSIAIAHQARQAEELRQQEVDFLTGTAVSLTREGPDIDRWLAGIVTPYLTPEEMSRGLPSDVERVLREGRGDDYSTTDGGWTEREDSSEWTD